MVQRALARVNSLPNELDARRQRTMCRPCTEKMCLPEDGRPSGACRADRYDLPCATACECRKLSSDVPGQRVSACSCPPCDVTNRIAASRSGQTASSGSITSKCPTPGKASSVTSSPSAVATS